MNDSARTKLAAARDGSAVNQQRRKLQTQVSRRAVLACGLQLPAAGVVLLAVGACGDRKGLGTGPACVDPQSMTAPDMGLIRSLQYTEKSADPNQVCAGCSFFEVPEQAATCGTCQLLHTTVNPAGRCESWAART